MQRPLSVQFSRSVVSDSLHCIMPGFHVHHQLSSIQSVMPSHHLIHCPPLLLQPSIFPSIRVFSNEPVHISWPNCWSFSFSISPSNNTQDWFPLGWTGWISLQSKGLLRVFANTTVQKHQFFGAQPSLQSNSHIHTWLWKNHSFDRPLYDPQISWCII